MSIIEESIDNRPSPENYMEFIPWACSQLQLNFIILIHKEYQHEYVSVMNQDRKKNKSKLKVQSRLDLDSDHNKDDDSNDLKTPVTADSEVIHIQAICDHADNLTQLKFVKNIAIPRILWKIIGLIVKYHSLLTNITIHGGMDQYTLHEICNFLNISNITELILDYSFLAEANYYLLLESNNDIYHISLAGCEIDDHVLKIIASKLAHPLPASKKLSILNLASNKITDDGAKFLADALRSNRHLSYLNLSNNRLSDKGAAELFTVLQEFVLTKDELMATRLRHMDFLRQKNDLIMKAHQELKAGDVGRTPRRKTIRAVSTVPKRGKLEKETSLKSFGETNAKSLINVDMFLHEKAIAIADSELGDFDDPFSSSNIVVRNSLTYCIGNNVLCYLNLSYNNMTYISLKEIVDLLKYQKGVDRKPIGLSNLIIEGNPLPMLCDELLQIDELIETGLATHRRVSVAKKRATQSAKRF
ncbi:uncharacterized protein LOC123715264 [Pieris brassicae]|nr:uncharacterized protein LOC123715264 [Pieris brassicae]